MVTYRMELDEEKRRAAIEVALESPDNVRRRRIGGGILAVLGVLLVLESLLLLAMRGPSGPSAGSGRHSGPRGLSLGARTRSRSHAGTRARRLLGALRALLLVAHLSRRGTRSGGHARTRTRSRGARGSRGSRGAKAKLSTATVPR